MNRSSRIPSLPPIADATTGVALICARCGTRGRYALGIITVDPVALDASHPADTIGFTGLVRCRRCQSPGPWDITADLLLHANGLMMRRLAGEEDVPLEFARMQTFDGRHFRFGAEAEDHLRSLVEATPDDAFRWTRLGNFYRIHHHAKEARSAYQRALAIDAGDIEAHHGLAQLAEREDRVDDAATSYHAVLRHARSAHRTPSALRRELVEYGLERLCELSYESGGRIPVIPPGEAAARRAAARGPLVVEISGPGDRGVVERVASAFLGELAPPKKARALPQAARRPRAAASARRHGTSEPSRNAPCPCYSGKKYKRCCGAALIGGGSAR